MKKFDSIINLTPPIYESDIEFVNNIYRSNKEKKVLIEIENTKGLSSELLKKLDEDIFIRVESGYDKDRIDMYEGVIFSDGTNADYLYDSVIYSRNELINILREIERIESGIKETYSDLEKIIYIYNYLKKDIMYDPKYETESSDKIRTLRGLIFKQTVCAGYSIIFKELLDRQDIECEYVEGISLKDESTGKKNRGHAWNIVTLNGKKYGFDLTWENSQYRKGNFHTYHYLGTNKQIFCKSHKPYDFEHTQDYEDTLSELDINLISRIYSTMLIDEEHSRTLYNINRTDSEPCTICHLGTIIAEDGKTYHKYFYLNGLPSTHNYPRILYSEVNMTKFIYSKVHGRGQEYTKEAQYAIAYKLFSEENIKDSRSKHTNYIGTPFDEDGNVIDKIEKREDIIASLNFKTCVFIRNDGSTIIIEEDNNSHDSDLYFYNCFELIEENGHYTLKSNYICTENNLIKDRREYIADKLLSREHIDQMCTYYNGYIGYCDKNGNILMDKSLLFDIEKDKKMSHKRQQYILSVPSYRDIVNNFENYDIDYKNNTVINKKSNKIISEYGKIRDITFAKLWFDVANVLAFNFPNYILSEETEDFYTRLFTSIAMSIEKKGFIDTKTIFENSLSSRYIFAPIIVVNLFDSKDKIDFIFEYLTGCRPQIKHEILYNLNYAYEVCGLSEENKLE